MRAGIPGPIMLSHRAGNLPIRSFRESRILVSYEAEPVAFAFVVVGVLAPDMFRAVTLKV